MNDEKYIYFTERIQNILVKPEILKLMKDVDDGNKAGVNSDTTADTKSGRRKSKRFDDIDVIAGSANNVNKADQMKRKKARSEKLAAAVQEEIV